jgi:hypothetical protein
MLAAVTFVSALLHPFEVFLIAPASAVTLAFVAWKNKGWTLALPECVAIAIAAGLGLTPYAYQAGRSPLIRDMPALFT